MPRSIHHQKMPQSSPSKKSRKEGRLKICSKCSPPQKYCEAALQKVPRYVYVAPTKNVKAAPLKKYHKAATTKCFTTAPLEISLQAPPDIETITVSHHMCVISFKIFVALSEFKLLLRLRLTMVIERSFAVSRQRFLIVALWWNKLDWTWH